MKFSRHALVLPFLTQQDLRAVLVFANSSLFLISHFFIIIASLFRCIRKCFWFSQRSVIEIFSWAIHSPNKIIKYINWSLLSFTILLSLMKILIISVLWIRHKWQFIKSQLIGIHFHKFIQKSYIIFPKIVTKTVYIRKLIKLFLIKLFPYESAKDFSLMIYGFILFRFHRTLASIGNNL